MKTCPGCNAQLEENSAFCGKCGLKLTPGQSTAQQTYQQPVYQPVIDIYNHTAEFDSKDISDNKVIAMLCYLMGIAGILIAAICAKESAYVKFHLRQALKFEVMTALLGIAAAAISVVAIIPFLGWVIAGLAYIAAVVGFAIILVLKIIAFFQICKGEAKEPNIIRDFKFLK